MLDDYARRRFGAEAQRVYQVLEDRLSGRDHVSGTGVGEFSIADIACFQWTRLGKGHGIALSDYPAVAAWSDRISARPSARAKVQDLRDENVRNFRYTPEQWKVLFRVSPATSEPTCSGPVLQLRAGLRRAQAPLRALVDVRRRLRGRRRRGRHGRRRAGAPGERDGRAVQNKPQLDRVRGLTEDAVARGGEVFFRGEVPDGPGYWFPTTLVRGVAEGVPLVDEEPFGPVLPILPYRDLDDAVRRANDTTYGLGASVWSPDLDRAAAVAQRLDAGSVWVNQHLVVTATVPFGGAKQSGLGVEGSLHGLHAYTDIKVINTKR